MSDAIEELRLKVLDINIIHLNQHTGEISKCSHELCQFASLADNAIFEIDGKTELTSFSIIGEQMKNIPMGTLNANRYDTDTEHVLHVWVDGNSFDIRVPKKEFLGRGAVEHTLAPDGGESAANSVYSRPECLYNYCPYTMPTLRCADVGHCLHPAAGKA